MFGKSTKITTAANISEEHQIQQKSSSESIDEFNPNFIFYNDNNNKFSHQVEIYAIPNNIKNKKGLVVVSHKCTISFLCLKIAEEFESYPEFKNLSSLKVSNLTKKTTKNEEIQLPKEGSIQDCIKTGDIIYCDVSSQEYWIKVIFKLHSLVLRKVIKLDYKISKLISFRYLKAILLKNGCNIFIEQVNPAPINEQFTYYIENIIFKINDKEQYNFNDEHKDREKVDTMFNYESEIIVSIKFGIFEELIHNEIRNFDLPNLNANHLRFNEFKETDFDEFISMKKFEPERQKIRQIGQTYIKKQLNCDKFLFFYKIEERNIDEIAPNEKIDFSKEEHLSISVRKSVKMIILLPYDTYYSMILTKKTKNRITTPLMPKTPTRLRKGTKNSNSFVQPSIIPSTLEENLLIEPLANPNDSHDSLDFYNKKKISTDNVSERIGRRSGSIKYSKIKEGPSFLQSVRDSSKYFNLCAEFNLRFSEEQFFTDIKKKIKFEINEEIFNNLPVFQFRDFEICLEKSYRLSKENEVDQFWLDEPTILINNRKILLFVFMLLLYFIGFIVVINYDFLL